MGAFSQSLIILLPLVFHAARPEYVARMPTNASHHDNLDSIGPEQDARSLIIGAHSSGRRLLQFNQKVSDADIQESKLLNVGCAISLTTVIDRGCALITETVPHYYIDKVTRSIKINETLTVSQIKTVCWGDQSAADPFGYVDASVYSQFAPGLGTKGMITGCGIVLKTSELACFGSNDPSIAQDNTISKGQADPPNGIYSQVAMGGLHGCALCGDAATCDTLAASIVCWGNNRMGQSTPPLILQTSVLITITYVHVHCGYEHTCALRSDNYLACWGSNLDGQTHIPGGQLAMATKDGGYLTSDRAYGCCEDCAVCDCGTRAHAGVGARCRRGDRLAASWYHTCAIRAGCDVQCVGNIPRCAAGRPASWYAAGTSCSCNSCNRPHALECWGYNAYGVATPPPGQFKAVVGGFDFTCAIYAECNGRDVVDVEVPGTNKTQCALANTVICWGRNNRGQAAPPPGLCNAALEAQERAERLFNNTQFETPPPPTPRPACICTPAGCDCLGQNPRLEMEGAPGLRGGLTAAAAAAAAATVWLLVPWW